MYFGTVKFFYISTHTFNALAEILKTLLYNNFKGLLPTLIFSLKFSQQSTVLNPRISLAN